VANCLGPSAYECDAFVTFSLLQLLVVERVRRARRCSSCTGGGGRRRRCPCSRRRVVGSVTPFDVTSSCEGLRFYGGGVWRPAAAAWKQLVVNRERVLLRSCVAADCGLVPPLWSIYVWPLLLRHRALVEALWLGGNLDCTACVARRGVAPRARSYLVRFLVARSLSLLIQRC